MIDGPATVHYAYGNELYRQAVRGTWNSDKTVLRIEENSLVEEGFYPAFGKGRSILWVEKWALDPKNEMRLFVEYSYIVFDRDTQSLTTENWTETYLQYKPANGDGTETRPAPSPGD